MNQCKELNRCTAVEQIAFSPAFANIMLGVVFLMDELTILKNQVIMMQALMCINELPNRMIKQLTEQILFTEARIRALS